MSKDRLEIKEPGSHSFSPEGELCIERVHFESKIKKYLGDDSWLGKKCTRRVEIIWLEDFSGLERIRVHRPNNFFENYDWGSNVPVNAIVALALDMNIGAILMNDEYDHIRLRTSKTVRCRVCGINKGFTKWKSRKGKGYRLGTRDFKFLECNSCHGIFHQNNEWESPCIVPPGYQIATKLKLDDFGQIISDDYEEEE